jgi:hypothetical protein
MTDWDSRVQEGWIPLDDAYIISEDDVKFFSGDEVYNYYDMKPGRLLLTDDDQADLCEPRVTRKYRKRELWFYFIPDDGSQRQLLNGERICSRHFARVRGFRDA